MHPSKKGPVFIAVTAVLWSFGGILIKLVPWDAMTIVGMRAIFAAAVIAIYMKRPRIRLTPGVLLGALCMSGTTVLYVFANKLTTAANAIMLQYTAPVFVILLSALFLRKRPRALDAAAVLVVFGGIALFFVGQLRGTALLGNALALLSGLSFAGVFLVNQMADASPVESSLLSMLLNFVIALPFIARGITWEPLPWLAITLLGVFQIGLAYVLFSIGIRTTAPVAASLIAAIEPILNPVWVALFQGELPGPWAVAGGVLVLGAVVAYNVLTARNTRYADALPAQQDTASPTSL